MLTWYGIRHNADLGMKPIASAPRDGTAVDTAIYGRPMRVRFVDGRWVRVLDITSEDGETVLRTKDIWLRDDWQPTMWKEPE